MLTSCQQFVGFLPGDGAMEPWLTIVTVLVTLDEKKNMVNTKNYSPSPFPLSLSLSPFLSYPTLLPLLPPFLRLSLSPPSLSFQGS